METALGCILLKTQIMTNSEIRHAQLLDLLFENRNKAYGAYTLRKYYPQRLVIALCSSLSLAAFLFLLLAINKQERSDHSATTGPVDEVVVHTQIIPEKPNASTPLPPPKLPRPVVVQQQYTQIRITTNPGKTTDVPTQAEVRDAAISNHTTEGAPATEVPAIAETGPDTRTEPEAKPAPAPAYAAPQFPGGDAAWLAFLSRNLQAPETLEPGEKKTVLVKFLVSADGSVTAFDVVQSGGAAFDKEVMRVLRKMPKWKPALRNG